MRQFGRDKIILQLEKYGTLHHLVQVANKLDMQMEIQLNQAFNHFTFNCLIAYQIINFFQSLS